MQSILSDDDVRMIRDGIREFSAATETLLQFAVSNPLPPHSPAASHRDSELNSIAFGTSTVTNDAYLAILLATSAGADHVRAYVSLLPKSRVTVAMSTLTRGALEAFAKAGYLLEPVVSLEFIGRYLGVTLDDLTFPMKHGTFRDSEGVEIDKIAYRDRLRELRATLEPTPKPTLRTTHQVGHLLESALGEHPDPDLNLPNIYSQLSGTAHAGATTLGMYLGPERQPTRFVYPRQLALEHVSYLFAAILRVGELGIEHFAISGGPAERWQESLRRSGEAMNRLREAT